MRPHLSAGESLIYSDVADFNHNHASLILKWILPSPLFTTEFKSFSL